MKSEEAQDAIETIKDIIVFPEMDDAEYQLDEIKKAIGLTDKEIGNMRQG